MKLLLSGFIVILFLTLGCDRCKNTVCDNGECERGFCKCPIEYVGDACEIQNEPKSIVVTSVEFYDLPEEIFIDNRWDDDTSTSTAYRPDVMLQVKLGNNADEIFNSVERYPNSESTEFVFAEQMRVKISEGFPALNFHLSDLDSAKPEFMYNVQVVGYYTIDNGFPTEISGENEDGVSYSIFVEYDY